jgi:type IV secretion system protein VirD4
VIQIKECDLQVRDARPSEEWLAVTLVILLATVGLFHAGVVVALFLSNSGSPTDIHSSAAALVVLHAHLRDPGQAWSEPINVAPLWFWFSEATIVALTAATMTATLRRLQTKSRKGMGVRPNAGIARTTELRRLWVRRPTSGRLTIGKVGRRLLATEPQTSLAVIGPTGCGKTAGFAIPAILEWNGPIIATSVKTDLIDATIAHRRQVGSVLIFDPTSCTAMPAADWSPLHSCKTWVGAQQMAAWMCEAAQSRLDTLSDGDYWYAQARKALAPYLLAAAIGDATMSDVVTWIDNQEEDCVAAILRDASSADAALRRMANSSDFQDRLALIEKEVIVDVVADMRHWFETSEPHFQKFATLDVSEWPTVFQAQLQERVRSEALTVAMEDAELNLATSTEHREHLAPLASLRSLWAKDQRLRDSVFATVENVVAPYAQLPQPVADHDRIDFTKWLTGNNTIYVVASSHEQARLRPILTTFVQQAVRAAFDAAVKNGGSLPMPCLTMLDEAGNIAPLRDLPAYASTARSHNISIVTVWQDLAQVRAIYRDRAQTVLNNHRAKLFGSGIADDQTLEYVSKIIGDVPHKERNTSRDTSSDRRTISEHTSFRRAAPIDELRRMDHSQALLVYGADVPALVKLRPWYEVHG